MGLNHTDTAHGQPEEAGLGQEPSVERAAMTPGKQPANAPAAQPAGGEGELRGRAAELAGQSVPSSGRGPGQLRGPSVARGAVPARAGCVVIDKPGGLTSHDVVAKVRRLAATKKVGHAGTLDPMATGVLVVGIGAATRLLTHITGTEKEYVATIRLGVATSTDDAEGEVMATPGCVVADLARLEAELAALTGQIMQVPATVSAIKVDGVRSYARVRAGQEVELAARPVTVKTFELTAAPRPATISVGLGQAAAEVEVVDLDVRVVCSAGTYIRALARDLGRAVGSAGHLTRLRRTRVGSFTENDAVSLEQASAQVEQDAASESPHGLKVRPLTDVVAAEFQVRRVNQEEAESLRRGMFLPALDGPEPGAAIGPNGAVALLRRQGKHDRPYVVFPANIEG